MNLGNNIYKLRKQMGLTQADIASKLDVSFQSVSLWERNETVPDIYNIIALADLFNISIDELINGEIAEKLKPSAAYFDIDKMYTYIKTFAMANNLNQTIYALSIAKEKHSGQYRKGKDKIPYIYHPLLMTCHAISLKLIDDDLLTVALLHDVIEDTDTCIEDLNISSESKKAILLLTKEKGYNNSDYYQGIMSNEIALIVKILDRCNNISHMAQAFSDAKMVEYIKETEEYIYPLIKKGQSIYPKYNNVLFVLKYHLKSLIESIKALNYRKYN